MKAALLVIDMQKRFLKELQRDPDLDNAVEHINYVSALMRRGGHSVLFIQDTEGVDDPEDPGIAVIDEIKTESDDIFVRKENSNAFWKTELKEILDERGADFLIVAGFSAEYCVLFSYQGALERGFKAALLQNGIVSVKPDTVAAAYRDRQVVSYSAIEYFLGKR